MPVRGDVFDLISHAKVNNCQYKIVIYTLCYHKPFFLVVVKLISYFTCEYYADSCMWFYDYLVIAIRKKHKA